MFLESKERTNHATLHCRMLLVALWPAIVLKGKKHGHLKVTTVEFRD